MLTYSPGSKAHYILKPIVPFKIKITWDRSVSGGCSSQQSIRNVDCFNLLSKAEGGDLLLGTWCTLTAVARRGAAESSTDLIHLCSCLWIGLLVFCAWFGILNFIESISNKRGLTLSISKPGLTYQRGVCVVFEHQFSETQAEHSPACMSDSDGMSWGINEKTHVITWQLAITIQFTQTEFSRSLPLCS